MRSMILPPPSGGASAVISWPSTLRWIVSSMRSRTVSLYFCGSNSSLAVCSMSCFASASSAGFTAPSGMRDFGRRPDFVGVVELLHHEHAVERTQQHEVLLPARRVLSERGATGLLERGGEQPVRAIAALVGAEVVDFLEVFAIDLRQRDELDDVDRLRRLLLERLELFGREDDVLVLRELVPLDGLVARDDLSLSFGQMYCCLRRVPHFLCSMLNETLAFDSEDE